MSLRSTNCFLRLAMVAALVLALELALEVAAAAQGGSTGVPPRPQAGPPQAGPVAPGGSRVIPRPPPQP